MSIELETQKKETVIHVSQIELWVIRLAGTCVIAVLGWIGVQFQQALIHVAEIRKELEIVKPADVLEALRAMERHSLTETDVKRILTDNAPWYEVRAEWEQWKHEITDRTRDRVTGTEFKTWVKRLDELNDDDTLKVPAP